MNRIFDNTHWMLLAQILLETTVAVQQRIIKGMYKLAPYIRVYDYSLVTPFLEFVVNNLPLISHRNCLAIEGFINTIPISRNLPFIS